MITTPPSAVSAISAVASLRASSRPRILSWLVSLCTVLAALLGSGGSTASAQTAHFSGGMPTSMSTLGSGFNSPIGVAVDSSGNIYVADTQNNAVREILAVNGSIPASPTIVTLGSGFSGPFAVALDGNGNVFVADHGNYAVKEILAVNGSIPSSPTIRTLATAQLPWGIAVDGNGNVFVSLGCVTTSLGLSRSSAMSTSSVGSCGPVEELLAVNGSIPAVPEVATFSSFVEPVGLSVDGSGNVFVADFGSNSVKEILAINGSVSTSSTIRTVASTIGSSGPTGVAVDANENVYAASPGNSTVYELLAVNGSIPASPTIATLGTSFNGPTSLAVDGSGNVYVSDTGNNRIVKMSPSAWNFGEVNIGTTSSVIPMLLTFDTPGILGSTAVLTQGATGLDFANTGTGTCTANTAFAAGQSCTINMIFTPRFAGVRKGVAVVYDSTGNAIANGYVLGTGVGPQITFQPGVLSTLNSSFNNPVGVAVDGSGNVYVADYGSNAVKEILAVNGIIPASPTIRTLGSGFKQPTSVALDGSGNVYVADYGNNSVKEILAINGSIPASPAIRILGSGFKQPSSVALDGSGNIYVADLGNSTIKEIVAVNGSIPDSPTIRTLETNAPALYLAVDGSGNVYASALGSMLAEILAVNGSIPDLPTMKPIATGSNQLTGLAVDAIGDIYVATNQNSVSEIHAVNGSIPASPTITTLSSAFNSLSGLAVDSSGNIYVADSGNHRVAKLDVADAPGLTFAATTVGSTSSNSLQPLSISNIGNAPLTFPIPSTGTNPSIGANFTLSSSSTCPSLSPSSYQPGTLPSGASCAMVIGFTPTVAGALSSSLMLMDNNLNATAPGYATQSISLSGTGLQPVPNFTLMAPSAMTVTQGASSTASIQVDPGSGFTGNVTLAVNGLPVGVTASFAPNPTAGTSTLTLTADNSATLGTVIVVINGTVGTQSVSTSMQVTVVSPPLTFTITAPDVSLIQGGTSQSIVTVTVSLPLIKPLNSFLLAVQGLPSGVTGSISPNPTSGTSVLTLTAHGTVVAGTYSVTIAVVGIPPGTPGGTTSFTLTVVKAPSFALSASPASLTIPQGGFGTSTLTVLGDAGFTGSVSLYDDELPVGVMTSYVPDQTTGTSVVTFTVSSDAPLGTYNASIVGTQSPWLPPVHLMIPLTIAPLPGFAPSSANLGAVNIGTASPVQTLTYNFGAEVTLGSAAVLTQGAAGLDFTDAGTGTCAANTAYTVGQSCTVNVTFTPKFAGTRNGAVVLNDNNGNLIATAYIQGSGVGPQINFLPGTETTVASVSDGVFFPYGIAVDGGGNLYIADLVNNQVLKETLTASGYTQSTIPTSGLFAPDGVAVDGVGNVYITDHDNNRVIKETPSMGGYAESVVADSSNNGIINPGAIAVDSSGNVYFTTGINGSLYKETLSAEGYTQSIIPTPGASSDAFGLAGVAVDGIGNVYVVDSGNDQVLKETPSAGAYVQSTLPISGMVQPYGVTVDGSGNVYIVDLSGNQVIKETLSDGNYIQSTVSTSHLNLPTALAVDGGGNVYISDGSNMRVLKEEFADAPSLTFASTDFGSTSTDSPQTITVQNVGNAPLSFPVPSSGSNPSISANFTLTGSGDTVCPLVGSGSSTSATLAAGATCQLPISFTPTTVGSLSGTLMLTDNNLNAAAPGYATQTILLSGTATQVTPAITWAAPAPITYGTALSGAELNATSTVAGTFSYSPAAGTVLGAGDQTLTATFTPTDTTSYTTATATATLTVNQATPTISWAAPAAITYGTLLSRRQLNATSTVAGTFTYSPAAGTVLDAGAQTLTVTFTPTDASDYTTATASVKLTVNKAVLTISWATPVAISYGTALSGTQLNATSTAAGTFAYSPAAGTVLPVGSNTLTVTFTPANPANYTTSTAKAVVTLTVNKATPAISWATPAPITYGTPLSATQLNASSAVAGKFVYSPAAGKVLAAGQQTLTATFTPANSTNYSTATATVTLTVNKATPAITWAAPAAIIYGTALSGTQLNAKASVPGAFVYSPAAGTVPVVGTQTLSVTFTPTDTADYTTASASVTLTVNPAPSFTLATSSTSLSVAQGTSGKSTITVNKLNGFTGNVTLAASGLPTGVTAAFATNPASGSSVLTLTASSSATVGSATITIKGTSGSLTASTTIALTVSCTPTTITPYISINGGSTWTQESSATVNSPSTVVDLGPQPTNGGSWSWTGPNKYTSTSRQINSIPLTVGTDLYVATYTNTSGCKSTQMFTITVK